MHGVESEPALCAVRFELDGCKGVGEAVVDRGKDLGDDELAGIRR
jgi:hypothetical protein